MCLKEETSIVIKAKLLCSKCANWSYKIFEPPISYHEFIDIKVNLICPDCNVTYISIPEIKDPEEKENAFNAIKRSVIESSEDWHSTLVEKYNDLQIITEDNLPGLGESLEFIISVQKILNIADCTLPFAGILLGSPSSLKTVGIELFRKWNNVFYTDSFSAKSFVSHSTAVKKQELAKIDMLPKIKNKFFLTPELSPTFAKKDDDLIEILGILTRILDGHGYESDTGAHGHRGYNEKIMFAWIGAAVDIPWKVHKALGTLGPKLYFLRLPKSNKKEEDYFDEMDKDFTEKVHKIGSALTDYLEWFDNCPDMSMDEESGLFKMTWNSQMDDPIAKRYLIRLGRLLAHLRGVANTRETYDTSGTSYAYTFATIEEPDRAITQLRNLARGHALSQGRNYITQEDVRIVIKVVFSTASMERVRIFELLLQFNGRLTTSQITSSLNIVNNTAKRTMTEFKALGLVTFKEGENENSVKEIILHKDFEWFLSEEFKQLSQKNPPSTALLSPKSLIKHVHDNEDKEKEGLEGYFYDSNLQLKPSEKTPDARQDKDVKIIESYRLLIVYRGSIFLNQLESGVRTCQLCGYKVDAYWFKHHQCESR